MGLKRVEGIIASAVAPVCWGRVGMRCPVATVIASVDTQRAEAKNAGVPHWVTLAGVFGACTVCFGLVSAILNIVQIRRVTAEQRRDAREAQSLIVAPTGEEIAKYGRWRKDDLRSVRKWTTILFVAFAIGAGLSQARELVQRLRRHDVILPTPKTGPSAPFRTVDPDQTPSPEPRTMDVNPTPKIVKQEGIGTKYVWVTITSEPSGAAVSVKFGNRPYRRIGKTPVTLKVARKNIPQVSVSKDGYKSRSLDLKDDVDAAKIPPPNQYAVDEGRTDDVGEHIELERD